MTHDRTEELFQALEISGKEVRALWDGATVCRLKTLHLHDAVAAHQVLEAYVCSPACHIGVAYHLACGVRADILLFAYANSLPREEHANYMATVCNVLSDMKRGTVSDTVRSRGGTLNEQNMPRGTG